jgi:hypothetical protein
MVIARIINYEYLYVKEAKPEYGMILLTSNKKDSQKFKDKNDAQDKLLTSNQKFIIEEYND